MKYSAVISSCGLFRYELEFTLSGDGPVVSVIMVNPSKADGIVKDSTIRKLDGFGTRLGWSKYIVANLFAYRATDIKELRSAVDPYGPDNMGYVLSVMLRSNYTVVAWGANGKLPVELRDQWCKIARMAEALNRPLYSWGVCHDGHPRHPVMIGYDTPLTEWRIAT